MVNRFIFCVLFSCALFLRTMCHAMESEIPQQTIQHNGIPKIDKKRMALVKKYGEAGIFAYTVWQVFEKYKLDKQSYDRIIKLIFNLPEDLVIEKKIPDYLDIGNMGRLMHHPHNKHVWVFSDNRNLSQYDLIRGEFFGHENSVYRFAYNPQGTLCAYATEYPSWLYRYQLHVYDLKTNNKIFTSVFCKHIQEMVFNHDGTKLVISEYNQPFIKVLDIASKELSNTAIDESYWRCIIRSPDGKTFASASTDMVALWNLQDQKIEYIGVPERPIRYQSLAFNSEGTSLGALQDDGNIKIWDLNNKKNKSYRIIRPNENWLAVKTIPDLDRETIPSPEEKPGTVLKSALSDGGSMLAQIIEKKPRDVYFRHRYLLSGECSIEGLAELQWLYKQSLVESPAL